ncbi:MAG: RNase P modulator RnpM [Candidatus Dormibacteria bacterium]
MPTRTCVGCRAARPRRELVRLVRGSGGRVEVDLTGKLDGRGAYLCQDEACWTRAERRKALERALQVSLDAAAWQNLLSSRPPLASEVTDSVAAPAT